MKFFFSFLLALTTSYSTMVSAQVLETTGKKNIKLVRITEVVNRVDSTGFKWTTYRIQNSEYEAVVSCNFESLSIVPADEKGLAQAILKRVADYSFSGASTCHAFNEVISHSSKLVSRATPLFIEINEDLKTIQKISFPQGSARPAKR